MFYRPINKYNHNYNNGPNTKKVKTRQSGFILPMTTAEAGGVSINYVDKQGEGGGRPNVNATT